MAEMAPSIVITIIALIVCLILAWLFIKTLAHMGGTGKNGEGGIRVIATTQVGSRERVSVISYKKKDYLVGITSSSIQLLDTFASESEDKVVDDKL